MSTAQAIVNVAQRHGFNARFNNGVVEIALPIMDSVEWFYVASVREALKLIGY